MQLAKDLQKAEQLALTGKPPRARKLLSSLEFELSAAAERGLLYSGRPVAGAFNHHPDS